MIKYIRKTYGKYPRGVGFLFRRIWLTERKITVKKFLSKINKNDLVGQIVFSVILALLVGFVAFYVFLPSINVFSVGFWVYLAAIALAASLPFMRLDFKSYVSKKSEKGGRKVKTELDFNKWAVIPVAVPAAVIILGLFISSTLFNARSYAGIIQVDESDFAEDLPETSEITNIALMDTDSAMMLGNRTLGSLSNVVSQFTVSPAYIQINYKGTPKKVTNLEYDGFFKWIGNRDEGVPGMVMVDPVGSSAEYIKLDEPMRYVDSAYFGEDLTRKLRFSYPTKIFNSVSFEIDDDGNPYYIVSCSKPQEGASLTSQSSPSPVMGSKMIISVISEAPKSPT